MKFTDEQISAVENNDVNIRIIACAGSGKTSTIAAKISFLLDPANGLDVKPENIIAFTYTEKAAVELKNRALSLISSNPNLSDIGGLADMYIGTIHGWCLRMLQDYEFGYQKFSVLDDIKLKLFVDKNYDSIGMKDVYKLSDPNQVMKIYNDTARFIQIMNIIRESDLYTLPSYLQAAKEKYESALLRSSYFDFTMIMTECLKKINERKGVYNAIRSNIKYLIVDEYQDINSIQDKLVKKIQETSLAIVTVVGDDDQNIYQWRGSNNAFIKEFSSSYKDVKSISLSQNFRSSKGIVDLASSLITNNRDRLVKDMVSSSEHSFTKGRDILYNEYATIKEENKSIALNIANLRGAEFNDNGAIRGLDYSDFCVLLRTWSKASAIAETLSEFNIPYITVGVNQLFDTPEVNAAMGIFQYLFEQVSKDELIDMWLAIPRNSIDLHALKQGITFLDTKFPANQKDRYDYSLQGIFWDFLYNSKIFEESFADSDSEEAKIRAEIVMYNLGKFSKSINDFEEINFNSSSTKFHLFNFLNFVRYMAKDSYPEGWLNNEYKTPNAVRIMTVHQSKGLEFPVVFIPGLNKNYLPSKKKGGLSEWHFLDRACVKNQDRYEGSVEDERRLLYVAITRAQKFLFISRAPDLANQLYTKPSEFVTELIKSNIAVSSPKEDFSSIRKMTPVPRSTVKNIVLNFSVLKDYFECPYRFKLMSMYGFNYPLNTRMGLGKSLHNSLMELHKRAKNNEPLDLLEVEDIVKRQTHLPYISKMLKERFEKIVLDRTKQYFNANSNDFDLIEFVEQDIQLDLGDGVLVVGRIDLIKKRRYDGEYETYIIEFKSNEDVQASCVTHEQLYLYALGHLELTGKKADYIQIYDLADNKEAVPVVVKNEDLDRIRTKIKVAAVKIREEKFGRVTTTTVCKECFQNRICSSIIKLNLQPKQ